MADAIRVSLAQEFSTPLFVMDEDAIRKTCRMYQNSLNGVLSGQRYGAVCQQSVQL